MVFSQPLAFAPESEVNISIAPSLPDGEKLRLALKIALKFTTLRKRRAVFRRIMDGQHQLANTADGYRFADFCFLKKESQVFPKGYTKPLLKSVPASCPNVSAFAASMAAFELRNHADADRIEATPGDLFKDFKKALKEDMRALVGSVVWDVQDLFDGNDTKTIMEMLAHLMKAYKDENAAILKYYAEASEKFKRIDLALSIIGASQRALRLQQDAGPSGAVLV